MLLNPVPRLRHPPATAVHHPLYSEPDGQRRESPRAFASVCGGDVPFTGDIPVLGPTTRCESASMLHAVPISPPSVLLREGSSVGLGQVGRRVEWQEASIKPAGDAATQHQQHRELQRGIKSQMRGSDGAARRNSASYVPGVYGSAPSSERMARLPMEIAGEGKGGLKGTASLGKGKAY